MPISRRSVLKLLSSSTFIFSATTRAATPKALSADMPALGFSEGVASADPQPSSVMLWTRAQPVLSAPDVSLLVQVSSDSDFKTVIVEELLRSSIDSDYTVRAYITGLLPDTGYYYRFIGPKNTFSRVGRTRTAPSHNQAKDVNLAFVSCQSYEQAFYGAWARMIADDRAASDSQQIQFVLQLGDFIYERNWKKTYAGGPQPRSISPFPDGVETEHTRHAVSLADYRHLYRTYLRDPHLQEARARWPFISIWDDHEFSNDNFQSYSNYGSKPTLEAQRKLNANQAWFEFVPAVLSELEGQDAFNFRSAKLDGDDRSDNEMARQSLRIYRSLKWGKHLDIVLTDTRSYRTGPCVSPHLADSLDLPLNTLKLIDITDYGQFYNDGNPPDYLPYGDGKTPNPARDRRPGTCMGEDQRSWFLDTLASSNATWKLWGNALPLMPFNLDLSSIPLADMEDSIVNLDAWAGYPYERKLIMSQLQEQKISGVVSLSGDHHTHGASSVSWSTTDPNAIPIAVDFACAGISSNSFFQSIADAAEKRSPEFQQVVFVDRDGARIPVWHMTLLQGVIASFTYSLTSFESVANWLGPNKANHGLKYIDSTANGYGLAQFTARDLSVQLVTMEDLTKPFDTPPGIKNKAKFHLPAWQSGESPVLSDPVFEGEAPFPFATQPV
ncbi:MAG: alkaline phosphatase D [Halioglobus sp.]|jgi:alkaline phosphatase D